MEGGVEELGRKKRWQRHGALRRSKRGGALRHVEQGQTSARDVEWERGGVQWALVGEGRGSRAASGGGEGELRRLCREGREGGAGGPWCGGGGQSRHRRAILIDSEPIQAVHHNERPGWIPRQASLHPGPLHC